MQWGKKSYGGVKYDLTHLDPFILEIPAFEGGGPINARVRFGSHVFTEKWSDNYIEAFRVLDGKQSRCFCPIRFGHSVHLPGIVRLSAPGRVLFDPSKKIVMLGNPPGVLSPYAIFFEMSRAKHIAFELDILVVSAHEHPQLKAKVGMDFPKLARMVANGAQVPWPKRK